MFIGTDNGLRVIDATTFQQVTSEDYDLLSDTRIRHILEDTKGNLWFSTYGRDGLVKVSTTGDVTVFNEAEGHTVGGRFRYCMELSDGTILAASNMGINYIRDDSVVLTIDEHSGMQAPQILSMVECEDGSVLAGSDGDGIYRITDGKITGHIGMEEGLETLVVLRIVPCRDGYLYVTSNALYYDDGAGAIIRLSAFPYTNNYDIFIADDKAWISSSAGIYVVRIEDLLANGDYHYTLLDNTRGFSTSLTANAWNAVIPETGNLLLCCTDGVRDIGLRTIRK